MRQMGKDGRPVHGGGWTIGGGAGRLGADPGGGRMRLGPDVLMGETGLLCHWEKTALPEECLG